MPDTLRIAYARGVTPGKWARLWAERFPRVPLELVRFDAVTDIDAELTVLRADAALLAFVRLPLGEDGEPAWPSGAPPRDLHVIPLYDERAVVVAPKDNAVEAVEDVRLADLDGELRHPFDDAIHATIELVAANVGVVVVPQSVARLYARKDVVARPVTDATGWRVGLAWLRRQDDPRIEDFIGVVRGRTANSSRGGGASADAPATSVRPSAAGGGRPQKPGGGRPSRGARKGRRPTR